MLVSMTSFPREESRMTTWDFITALFSHVDEQLHAIPKHPAAYLWPSEVVTLGLLHALKDVGNQAFYRWLTRDYRVLFPLLPERTRLFRLFKQNPQSARRNNFLGEQILGGFLLLSENFSASNYPGAAHSVFQMLPYLDPTFLL
jgi:hypothetical protein